MINAKFFKSLRPHILSKRLRLAREEATLYRDMEIAFRYIAIQQNAAAHNVAHGCYAPAAPRASPSVH